MKENVKQQMIYEAFDVLKDSWEDHSDSLLKCIVKMYKINTSTSLEMWLYILRNNQESIGDDSYSIITNVIDDIVGYDDKEAARFAKLVFKNKELCKFIYGANTDLSETETNLLTFLLLDGDIANLTEILKLIENNANAALGEAVAQAINNINSLDEDDFKTTLKKSTLEWLEYYIMGISDKKERAVA